MDIGQMFPQQSSLSLASATLLPNCAAMSLYLVPQMHPHFLPSHHCPRQFDIITFCLKSLQSLLPLQKGISYFTCLAISDVISVLWAKPASLPNLHTHSTLCLYFDPHYSTSPPGFWGHHICAAQMLPLHNSHIKMNGRFQWKSILVDRRAFSSATRAQELIANLVQTVWTEIPSESFSTGKEKWTLSEPKWSHQEKVLLIKIAWQ